MNTEEDLAREIRALEKKVLALEEISDSPPEVNISVSSNYTEPDSIAQIMKRIYAVQNLVDQIEIELDKLELRVSAIEHMGFRLRTSGQ